jgi:5-(carboxyamino)imidazole ribonucleotide synthase
MFAIAAREMGYRVHTYSPDTDTPTGQVADLETVGAYDDLESVRRFAKGGAARTWTWRSKEFDAGRPIIMGAGT